MSCKIEVEHNSKAAGRRCYYLMTSDAASLEARVATADTALNDDGIDPVLSELYRPGSPMGEDLHTATSYSTFGKSIDLQINEIYDEESGKTFLCLDEQYIIVKRNGKMEKVLGKELQESDSIVGYVEDVKDFEKQEEELELDSDAVMESIAQDVMAEENMRYANGH